MEDKLKSLTKFSRPPSIRMKFLWDTPPPSPGFIILFILCYADTEDTFYYEGQLKCAMKTDAIYVHHPFAGEKLETTPFNRI